MRNKYKGTCACGAEVKEGEGYFQRSQGRWIVKCIKCVTENKIAQKKPLSNEQYKFSQKHL